MIPAPKALVIGATAEGEYSLLYSGGDVAKAETFFETHPLEICQVFLYRNGALFRTKETPTAILTRRAIQDDFQRKTEEAIAKAQAEAKAKAEADAAAKVKAQAEAAAKVKAEVEERARAKNERDAEILKHAAERKAKLAQATAAAVAGAQSSGSALSNAEPLSPTLSPSEGARETKTRKK